MTDKIFKTFVSVTGWMSYLGATALIGLIVYWSVFLAPKAGQPITILFGCIAFLSWLFASWVLVKNEPDVTD